MTGLVTDGRAGGLAGQLLPAGDAAATWRMRSLGPSAVAGGGVGLEDLHAATDGAAAAKPVQVARPRGLAAGQAPLA